MAALTVIASKCEIVIRSCRASRCSTLTNRIKASKASQQQPQQQQVRLDNTTSSIPLTPSVSLAPRASDRVTPDHDEQTCFRNTPSSARCRPFVFLSFPHPLRSASPWPPSNSRPSLTPPSRSRSPPQPTAAPRSSSVWPASQQDGSACTRARPDEQQGAELSRAGRQGGRAATARAPAGDGQLTASADPISFPRPRVVVCLVSVPNQRGSGRGQG